MDGVKAVHFKRTDKPYNAKMLVRSCNIGKNDEKVNLPQVFSFMGSPIVFFFDRNLQFEEVYASTRNATACDWRCSVRTLPV